MHLCRPELQGCFRLGNHFKLFPPSLQWHLYGRYSIVGYVHSKDPVVASKPSPVLPRYQVKDSMTVLCFHLLGLSLLLNEHECHCISIYKAGAFRRFGSCPDSKYSLSPSNAAHLVMQHTKIPGRVPPLRWPPEELNRLCYIIICVHQYNFDSKNS